MDANAPKTHAQAGLLIENALVVDGLRARNDALAVALERGRSRGIQLQAIEALGELGDADAQRALRVVADRWLTPRAIRRAARAALARRDARRSA
jgi:hypothetical protein